MRRAKVGRAAALLPAVIIAASLALESAAVEEPPPPPATEPASEKPETPKPAPAADSSELKIDEASSSVTSALQGQDGMRIQTMCTHCNSANIQVGGLVADLVPIAYGGYPLFGGLATSFVMSMLPADSIAEAQVTRGPGEPQAPGTAAGGVIRLTAATPNELPLIDVGLDGGSFKRRAAALRFAGALTSWMSGVATAGGETADAIDAHNDGANSVPAIRRGLGDLRLDFTPAKGHRIEAGGSWVTESDTEGRGAVDPFKTTPTQGAWTREDNDLSRNEYRVGWEWRHSGGRLLSVRGLGVDRAQDVISQDKIGAPMGKRYAISERDYWGEIKYSQPVGLTWRVVAGVEEITQRVSADGFAPPPTSFHNQQAVEQTDILGGFAEAGYTPSARWDGLFGVRYERAKDDGTTTTLLPVYQEITGSRTDSLWEPRLTVKYRPVQGLTLKLIAGRTFRVPRPIFTEVCCGRRYLTNVEAGVGPESAATAGFEILYQPSPALKVSAYAAQTEFRDHIIQLVTNSFFYRQVYANTNIDQARAQTAEVAARWSATRVVRLDGSVGWLSFHNVGDRLVPVKYRDFSNQLKTATIPIDRIPYRPSSSASIGGTFTLPRSVVLTAQANYTGSQEIQQFDQFSLLDEPRHVAGFWMENLGVTATVSTYVELAAGVDNLSNFVQTDLGEVTRDYNWGPLAGRTFRFGVRLRLSH